MDSNTIVAIATPSGSGGIGILRLSGKNSKKIAEKVFKSKDKEWIPLLMKFGTFMGDGFNDIGYAVYMPPAKAYTGEETVEFYLHGGKRIMQGALETILEHGAKLAERGEFTRRSFLNGKMRLSDCEGVIDMINAESLAAVKSAYRLMKGDFAKKVQKIAESLSSLIVEMSASLDYPDEMGDEIITEYKTMVPEIKKQLEELRDTYKTGRVIKNGINCVLTGDVNVGKSSILNAIVDDDRAIVTDIPGTTRDTIKESIEYKGVKLTFIDTAGIRESSNIVERKGIEKGLLEKEKADVVLEVLDSTKNAEPGEEKKNTLYVVNKIDKEKNKIEKKRRDVLYISAKNKTGIKDLLDAILSLLEINNIENYDLITSERHYEAINGAIKELNEIDNNMYTDMVLVCLISAKRFLDEITGESVTEDIINKIFERFCVGK